MLPLSWIGIVFAKWKPGYPAVEGIELGPHPHALSKRHSLIECCHAKHIIILFLFLFLDMHFEGMSGIPLGELLPSALHVQIVLQKPEAMRTRTHTAA
jgi:hypothetical protein